MLGQGIFDLGDSFNTEKSFGVNSAKFGLGSKLVELNTGDPTSSQATVANSIKAPSIQLPSLPSQGNQRPEDNNTQQQPAPAPVQDNGQNPYMTPSIDFSSPKLPDIPIMNDLPLPDLSGVATEMHNLLGSAPKIDVPNITTPDISIDNPITGIINDFSKNSGINMDSLTNGALRQGEPEKFGEFAVGDGFKVDLTGEANKIYKDAVSGTALAGTSADDLLGLVTNPQKFIERKGIAEVSKVVPGLDIAAALSSGGDVGSAIVGGIVNNVVGGVLNSILPGAGIVAGAVVNLVGQWIGGGGADPNTRKKDAIYRETGIDVGPDTTFDKSGNPIFKDDISLGGSGARRNRLRAAQLGVSEDVFNSTYRTGRATGYSDKRVSQDDINREISAWRDQDNRDRDMYSKRTNTQDLGGAIIQ
jgi:hypothetical protein